MELHEQNETIAIAIMRATEKRNEEADRNETGTFRAIIEDCIAEALIKTDSLHGTAADDLDMIAKAIEATIKTAAERATRELANLMTL